MTPGETRAAAARPCAVVTGASSGIGTAFARALHARGDRVVLVARRAERLEQLARDLGGEALALPLPLDVTAPDAADRLEAFLASRGLHVELLVNNAGAGDTGPFAEQPEAGLRAMIDLNVTAVVLLTRRVLPGMLARRRGAVINVVSTGAFQPVPFLNLYSATKACVLSFTEALAVELKGSGVRVQALCPGPTETEFFEVAHTGGKLWINRVPRAKPEVVAKTSLRALERGRLRVFPGFLDRVVAQLVRVAPASLVRHTAGALYRPR